MREPFTQVAGDDALHPLVDLEDTPSSPGAQRQADRKAKKDGGKQAARERPANNACDLLNFVGISSDHQYVAIGQTSRDQAGRLFLSTASVYPDDYGVLCCAFHLETGWLAFHIARDPAAIWAKQSDEPNPSQILPYALVDRVEPLAGWQVGKDIHLQTDCTVESHRQVMFHFQVDEPEQCNGESRKCAGYQKGPAERR